MERKRIMERIRSKKEKNVFRKAMQKCTIF